ncbi:uncharacterized protein BKA78DRAFT_317426 [Phyllosticta capitalensis]|uniref:uncharacterized protein n=1 Tax=Phyllosticta capitalensis TaxID=121624 RepID=UPI00312D9A68
MKSHRRSHSKPLSSCHLCAKSSLIRLNGTQSPRLIHHHRSTRRGRLRSVSEWPGTIRNREWT